MELKVYIRKTERRVGSSNRKAEEWTTESYRSVAKPKEEGKEESAETQRRKC